MIDDERLIAETRSHWVFGADNSGDIRRLANIEALATAAAATLGPVGLVTADGSISCADNPAEQEAITAQLHYCEMVAALSILAPGGSFVLKVGERGGWMQGPRAPRVSRACRPRAHTWRTRAQMFTLFEHGSLGMMYVLNHVFAETIVCKPANSTAGNSETYIVARGYKGISPVSVSACNSAITH
jgi:cap2 methyltransferase